MKTAFRGIALLALFMAFAEPAFATLPASDNFSGTTLDANWTIRTGTFQVASGVVSSTTSGESDAIWNADTFPNDQWSQITAESNTTGDYEGVILRANSSGSMTYYGCRGNASGGGSVEIYKEISGTYTSLITHATTFGTGSVLKCTVVGTTITLYVNGTQVTQTTDSSITSGSAGIFLYGTTSSLGTWSAGAMSSGVVPSAMFLGF